MAESRPVGKRRSLIVIAVLVVLAIVGAGGYFMTSDSSASAAVTLVSARSAGPDPFTDSVAIGPAVTLPGNVKAIATTAARKDGTDDATRTRSATGTAPGLYGGTGDTRVCDPEELVSFLAANPTKARAWSAALGITPSGIKEYVAKLTPLLLTRDTLVTNHGYVNGRANAFQAVLQAGTAVLVDSTGVPRVKCGCGNPLGPAASRPFSDAQTIGAPWPDYEPTGVTTVRPGPPGDQFGVIDVHTGDSNFVPTGSTHAEFVVAETADQVNSETTTIATSVDGKNWKTAASVPQRIVGLSQGNGKWVAIASVGQNFRSRILTSIDLVHWATATDLDGTLLTGVAYGNGRWVAVGTGSQGGVILTSTDGSRWTPSTGLDFPLGEYPNSVTFGHGKWVAAGGQGTRGLPLFLTSTDAATWSVLDATVDATDVRVIAFGNEQWQLGGDGWYESSDPQSWTRTSAARGPVGYAYGNGRWLAATVAGGELGPNQQPAAATVSSSTNGTTWSTTGIINQAVTAIAYGTVGGAKAPTEIVHGPTTGPGLRDGTYLLAATNYEGCSATSPLSTMVVAVPKVTIAVDGAQLAGTIIGRAKGRFVANANAPNGDVNVTIAGTTAPDGSFVATSAIVRRTNLQACQPNVTGTPTGGALRGKVKALPPEAHCDTTGVEAAVNAGRRVSSVHNCDDGWAALSVILDGGDEGAALAHWDGSKWVRGSCQEPTVPADVLITSCIVS